MGPFEFTEYRGTNKTFALVKNILTGRETSVSASHLIPFDAEISPALIS